MTTGAIAIADWRSAIGDFRLDYSSRLEIGDWRFQIGLPGWRSSRALGVIPLSNDRSFDQSQICNRRSAIANHSVAAVIRNLRLHPPSILVFRQQAEIARSARAHDESSR
jgi:hypothetical protein